MVVPTSTPHECRHAPRWSSAERATVGDHCPRASSHDSYCTSFCSVDAQCAVANYVDDLNHMVVFTCETFPDGLKMCFANAD